MTAFVALSAYGVWNVVRFAVIAGHGARRSRCFAPRPLRPGGVVIPVGWPPVAGGSPGPRPTARAGAAPSIRPSSGPHRRLPLVRLFVGVGRWAPVVDGSSPGSAVSHLDPCRAVTPQLAARPGALIPN